MACPPFFPALVTKPVERGLSFHEAVWKIAEREVIHHAGGMESRPDLRWLLLDACTVSKAWRHRILVLCGAKPWSSDALSLLGVQCDIYCQMPGAARNTWSFVMKMIRRIEGEAQRETLLLIAQRRLLARVVRGKYQEERGDPLAFNAEFKRLRRQGMDSGAAMDAAKNEVARRASAAKAETAEARSTLELVRTAVQRLERGIVVDADEKTLASLSLRAIDADKKPPLTLRTIITGLDRRLVLPRSGEQLRWAPSLGIGAKKHFELFDASGKWLGNLSEGRAMALNQLVAAGVMLKITVTDLNDVPVNDRRSNLEEEDLEAELNELASSAGNGGFSQLHSVGRVDGGLLLAVQATTATDGSAPTDEPTAPEKTSAAIAPGARVELQGLLNAPDLNGKHGLVVRWNATQERWAVRLDGEAKPRGLRAANLIPLEIFG